MGNFNIKAAVVQAWEFLRGRFWFLVLLFLGIGVVLSLLSFVEQGLQENMPALAFLVGLISAAVNIIVGMGTIQIMLRICQGSPGTVSDLWEPLPRFFIFLGASILYGLMVMLGMLLLVVPGVIIAVRCQFFGYFIIDKQLGPIAALKESFTITRGHFWRLIGLSLVLAGINILGVIALVIGLFVTIPLTSLTATLVYLSLAASPEEITGQNPA